MNTVERILALQEKAGITNKDLEKAANLANGSVTNWKNNRYFPSVGAIINLANYFHVTTDYLLCLSDTQNLQELGNSISSEEWLLIDNFRLATTQGKFRIIQVSMNERDNSINASKTPKLEMGLSGNR